MKTVFLLVCALVLGRSDGKICLPGWTEIKGRCYIYLAQLKTWTQAQLFCQTMGGNLASVGSAEEYNRIQQLTMPSMPQTWIGASDCQETGVWFWMDGTPVMYDFWCPAKPEKNKDCCMQMNTGDSRCWSNVNCNSFLPYVCVKKAEL